RHELPPASRPSLYPSRSWRSSPVGIFLGLLRSLSRTALGHRLCSGGNCLDDVVVAGVATDVAVELLANVMVSEIIAAPAHDLERGDDHSGRAEPALQAMML